MSDAGTGIAVRSDSGGRDVLFSDVGCSCEFPVSPCGVDLDLELELELDLEMGSLKWDPSFRLGPRPGSQIARPHYHNTLPYSPIPPSRCTYPATGKLPATQLFVLQLHALWAGPLDHRVLRPFQRYSPNGGHPGGGCRDMIMTVGVRAGVTETCSERWASGWGLQRRDCNGGHLGGGVQRLSRPLG